jgi:hypothetical protein
VVKNLKPIEKNGFRSHDLDAPLLLKPKSQYNPVSMIQFKEAPGMIWAGMLAYLTGTVDQELLLRNEYLAAENRILRAQIKGRLLLSDAERVTLAEIAHRLGRNALDESSAVAKPDTLLTWYRKLIVKKFDGSTFRKSWVVPESTKKRSTGWCESRRRIRDGAMTGS